MSREKPGDRAPSAFAEAGKPAGTEAEAPPLDDARSRVAAVRAQSQSGRLGGARADFVASLGRKVEASRALLRALENEPKNRSTLDDLRRKVHALGAGARLLRFEVLADALATTEATLDRIAGTGEATARDIDALARIFDDLPSLAWNDPAARAPANQEAPRVTTRTALVFGDDDLRAALAAHDSFVSSANVQFHSEGTTDDQLAFELARSILPEIILLDGDLPNAVELMESLAGDPATEAIPVVVLVGSSPEHAANFVLLGAEQVLRKPAGTDSIYAACSEIVEQRSGKSSRMTLGDPTLEQLADRLADEVRRAIVGSVDDTMRSQHIPLGEGTEVVAAIWGAIARIREVVVTRSDGAVRFAPSGPEGAIAMAPWLHPDVPAAERVRTRGAAADVKLEGKRVIVADDDPGVTWFISDLLRTNGCIVHEALDGQTALDLAYRLSPDLVVSDILMPGLDGFALSRAIKRDVALRDVPIILLSWKEDLLQRVRELGVSASAYLRKESDARAIVARVREALWGKARIEVRLRSRAAEVRGRLDGLTVRSLLELVCSHRPSSRVSVRDACFLYELDLEDGVPRRLARTGGDGTFERGERVLAAMLGASAGWFLVSPLEVPLKDELHASMNSLLSPAIVAARGAAQAICGAKTISVERIVVDLSMMDEYMRVTPAPARQLIERIADGASPRAMLLAGEVDPWLLEDVLVDLTVRGVVREAYAPSGEELLGPAIDAAHAVLHGLPRRSISPKAPSAPAPALRSEQVAREIKTSFVDDEDSLPSSLADAVMRELKQHSSNPPPLIEPSALRPRYSSIPVSYSKVPVPNAALDGATLVDTVYEARIQTPSAPVRRKPAEAAPHAVEVDVDASPSQSLAQAVAANASDGDPQEP